tara:strand:+ start:5468 stop:6763 length:1296 start_codon:yes stop_codon:yes gene_type:complete
MQKEKIAIIGSGISGLSSALFLSKKYEVHLFEKNNLLGGHTRTVSLNINNCDYNIDTGFIVFNKKNYPDLVNFFNYLNVKTHNSNMSFAISFKDPEFEYGSSGFNSLFGQKKNIFSYKFWILIKEIIKLYNICKKINYYKKIENITLDEFLNQNRYSNEIRDYHIYPMISSIWSCRKSDVKKFPLISFINFFDNHKLFNLFNRHQWKYVEGGSYQYIKSITSKKLFNYRTNCCVKKIINDKKYIKIIFENNEKFIVDKVILATHADQALNLLDQPSKIESELLSKFKYSKNHAYLHADESFMPTRKNIWSSWNFLGNTKIDNSFSLTYWMNKLQNIDKRRNFFVTINPIKIPNHIYDQTIFEHPIFDLDILDAQKNLYQIQGLKNIWYCGSYCGYGFHEDGIQSAAHISNLLGAKLPWKRSENFINRLKYL